jgi:hypothetical protein
VNNFGRFAGTQKNSYYQSLLGGGHNSFFGPNAQIPKSKYLIWNRFGTGLG